MPTNSKEYMKSYYQSHKDKLGKKVWCETCQIEISKWNLYKHNKTERHLRKCAKHEECTLKNEVELLKQQLKALQNLPQIIGREPSG